MSKNAARDRAITLLDSLIPGYINTVTDIIDAIIEATVREIDIIEDSRHD